MPRLIEADAYRKKLAEAQEYLDEDTLLTAINLLDCAPTIDPESLRPHGWWIPFLDGEHIMPERYYRCSRCGRVERRKESYCHCGAKMDLEEEV